MPQRNRDVPDGVLTVRNVGVWLSGREVLKDVAFAVHPGEFVGLIGSNGAGKTTLLRVILGLQKPSSGSVSVAGRRRGAEAIGYLPQKVALDVEVPLRARDVVALGLDGHRLGIPLRSKALADAVDEMLAAVGASAFANARIGQLSGGQQQRVLLAHALVSKPRLLLLDEPLANLDPASAHDIVALLGRVCVDRGVAVVLTAHDMNPLLSVMDRIVYLANGKAVAGTTDAVARTEVLSALYGRPIQVIRAEGRVLVVAGEDAAGSTDAADLAAPREAEMSAVLGVLFAPGFFGSGTVQSALAVGALVAFVAGVVGVFTVTRGQSFAGHALADLGAVGGSAAFLVGISQLWGFIGAGLIAAILMEIVGIKRVQGRDVATGIVFGFGLGLTALFLYWDTTISHASNAAVSVLFGSLFVINGSLVPLIAVLSAIALAMIVAIYRWLLLDAVSSDLAAVRGVPVRLTGIVFLAALALTVELTSLTIGAILSTALLIGPAATALRLTTRIGPAVLVAGLLGVVATWIGIVVSYDSYYWFDAHHNWPVSFCIVAIVFLAYLGSGAVASLRQRSQRQRSTEHADGLPSLSAVHDGGSAGL